MGSMTHHQLMNRAMAPRERMDEQAFEKRSDIGQVLRESREAYQIPIEEMAHAIVVSPACLEALERGDWSVFYADVYARGFLKKYAYFLGFEPEEILSQLESRPQVLDFNKTPLLTRQPQAGRLRPFVLSALLILISFGLGALLAPPDALKENPKVKQVPESMAHYLQRTRPRDVPPIHTTCLHRSKGAELWPCYFGLRARASEAPTETSALPPATRLRSAMR